ncbi:hypothetical protein FRB99_005363 [Tulasnella sp. 403]|nr:hypothetical protein FRB99_005363 [Tulasnella sp. 403]
MKSTEATLSVLLRLTSASLSLASDIDVPFSTGLPLDSHVTELFSMSVPAGLANLQASFKLLKHKWRSSSKKPDDYLESLVDFVVDSRGVSPETLLTTARYETARAAPMTFTIPSGGSPQCGVPVGIPVGHPMQMVQQMQVLQPMHTVSSMAVGHAVTGALPGQQPTVIVVPAPQTPATSTPPRSLSRRKSVGRSPWEQEAVNFVIDVDQCFMRLREEILRINPNLCGNAKPFPLIVDLRMGLEKLWKRPPQAGAAERWEGHHEPAVLPKVDYLILLSPLIDEPIKVSNFDGVTCGDVIGAIHEVLHRTVDPEDWQELPPYRQITVQANMPMNRQPFLPGSAIHPQLPTVLDTLDGYVSFEGLVRHKEMVIQRLGYDHPAAFAINLALPKHIFGVV